MGVSVPQHTSAAAPANALGRRRRRQLGWAIPFAAGFVVCAALVGLHAVWPDPTARDQVAFLSQASNVGIGQSEHSDDSAAWSQDILTANAWIGAHPDLVIAEGDRACQWLEAQPVATTGDDPTFSTSVMTTRYVSGTTGLEIARVYPEAREHVADWAWAELCQPTRNSHVRDSDD